ncbi:MAG: DHH family phosphoesterase, partial [Bdellovibrionales bacterium]|nr:DHH family phosphoesterase [Bdellovibrionales bacterium]
MASSARSRTRYGIPVSQYKQVLSRLLDVPTGHTVAIIGHRDPDPDAAACIELLKMFLSELYYQDVRGYCLEVGQRLAPFGFKAQAPSELLALIKERGRENVFVILVDAPRTDSKWVGGELAASMPMADLVIDHHSADPIGKLTLCYRAPRSAATTLVIGLIETHHSRTRHPLFTNDPAYRDLRTLAAAALLVDAQIPFAKRDDMSLKGTAVEALRTLGSDVNWELVGSNCSAEIDPVFRGARAAMLAQYEIYVRDEVHLAVYWAGQLEERRHTAMLAEDLRAASSRRTAALVLGVHESQVRA